MTRRGWRMTVAAGAIALVAALVGRGGALDVAVNASAAQPPDRLSETGLYSDLATLTVDPRNRPFTPQYPLWTDGAAKRRWVYLPEGAVIDTSRADRWEFPVGTKFWKEFAFDGRPVETRLLWKVAPTRWAFASYVWEADGRDARRAPEEGLADVRTIRPGKQHSVPSLQECRDCHETTRVEVMGFTALQLSTDRDPLAPHAEPVTDAMVTLRTLLDEDRLRPRRAEWLTTPPRVRAATPEARAALGYLSSNCGSCHNRDSSIASLGLFLRYELDGGESPLPDAVATTRDRTGHWEIPTVLPGTSRLIAPGHPELSALLHRARSRRPSSQMPPVGSVIADADGVALLTSWIAGLDEGSAAPRPAPSH